MPARCAAVLISGFVLFAIGTLARVYMNILVDRARPGGPRYYFTEVEYLRLRRERGASLWPLVVAVICLPLGGVLALAAIVCAA